MKIETCYSQNSLKSLFDGERITKCFNNYLKNEKKAIYEKNLKSCLYINFISDTEIKNLNSQLRGKNKVTDVLSWQLFDIEIDSNQVFGEIYISNEYVSEQALKKGIERDKEVVFLICHGFLHICGFTHENDEDEAEMNRVTKRLLEEIGIDYYIDII